MIAVCGSPESGKTTAALKLAQELYFAKKGTVLFLSPDMSVPALSYLFPLSLST
jgi:adenylate kinase family enzyme